MYPALQSYLKSLSSSASELPADRRRTLEEIAHYVQTNNPPRLTFICTHNSRRSQLCQVWAETIAHYFEFEALKTFSGGTEVTAFHPHAVEALRRCGFRIEQSNGQNPVYNVKHSDEAEPVRCYSKTYDHVANPKRQFAAIMTCSEADKNCPFVAGSDLRVPLPYEDPKVADGTSTQQQVYDERCRQIAKEMYFLMQKVVRTSEESGTR